ncbi:universal stress protein [Nocardioides aestuarii]|uniref:Universal stress protein n=1 Tax=Nocardioides aestuarii TaxID=252231 RepID=A0ABW4TU15_9ACTN
MDTVLQPGVGQVVVGVDGRTRSASALRRAAEVAQETGVPLRLVHVTPSVVLDGAGDVAAAGEAIATAVLDGATAVVEGRRPGLAVRRTHRVGSRADGLARAAGPDGLVVLGRAHREGPVWWPHGSLAASVAARHTGPVLVVPEVGDESATHGRVVVGSTASGTAEPGLATLFDWAERHDATLVFVHAWWAPDPYVDVAEQRTHAVEHEERTLTRLQRTLAPHRAAHPEVPVEVRVRHGRPVHVLLAESDGADLLVLPREHTHRWLPGHVGTTTRALLRESSVPVLLLAAYAAGPAGDLSLEDRGELVR